MFCLAKRSCYCSVCSQYRLQKFSKFFVAWQLSGKTCMWWWFLWVKSLFFVFVQRRYVFLFCFVFFAWIPSWGKVFNPSFFLSAITVFLLWLSIGLNHSCFLFFSFVWSWAKHLQLHKRALFSELVRLLGIKVF